MAVKPFAVVASALVVLLGYCLYQPVPADYSSPWSLRLTVAKFKCVMTLMHTLHEYGIKSLPDIVDEVYQKTHPADHPDRYADVLVNDVLFENITVRLYRSKQEQNLADSSEDLLPGLVYYHGGGFVFGNPHTYDEVLIQILRATDLVIASVHYRLAPKYPFPVPVEDCVQAAKYFILHAADYGVDAKRIGWRETQPEVT